MLYVCNITLMLIAKCSHGDIKSDVYTLNTLYYCGYKS